MSFPIRDALTQQPSSKGKAEGKTCHTNPTELVNLKKKKKTQSNRHNLVVQGTAKGVKVIL